MFKSLHDFWQQARPPELGNPVIVTSFHMSSDHLNWSDIHNPPKQSLKWSISGHFWLSFQYVGQFGRTTFTFSMKKSLIMLLFLINGQTTSNTYCEPYNNMNMTTIIAMVSFKWSDIVWHPDWSIIKYITVKNESTKVILPRKEFLNLVIINAVMTI